LNIAFCWFYGLLVHHVFEVLEVDTSVFVRVYLGNKVSPVALIELIVGNLESVLEVTPRDGSTPVCIKEIESPS
jgi:hypothetical protein